jgi:hypothetical protein
VGPGSNLVIRTWADIKGNHQAGIIAGPAGTMNVVACCAGSSSQFYGTIRISDNGVGVRVNAGGSAGLTAFQTPAGQVSEVVVENNANWGVLASNLSQVNLNGNVVVQGNMAAPSGGGAATFPAGVAAVTGSIVALGPGSKIQNNGGTTGTKIPAPGVRADLQGIVRLGSPAADATAPGFLGITITGNTDGGVVLTHMSIADSYPGNSFTGNTGSDASCDSSSQLVGDTKGIGVVKCSANAK